MALAAFANVPDNSNTVSFDISDDESDCDRGYTSVCTLLVIQQQTKGSTCSNAVEGPLRRIAGTRHVSNYRERTGLAPAEGTNVQLLQSITAIPALADRSFEEIRLECYSQSVIATGKPPQTVNTSSAVIPPLFMPVRDDNSEEAEQAVTMLDI